MIGNEGMNIVLIGYRGTGKTTVGMALSKRLGKAFCDTDDYIERKAKRPISDMVSTEGWAFFRAKEKEAIREVSSRKDCVIAAGGGAILDDENVENFKKNGIVVLLEATTQTIHERMQGDKRTDQQRPSLTGKDPYEEIEEVLEFRRPFYQRAMDFSVDTTSKSIDQVLDEIVRKLERKSQGHLS
ncbi:MAG: shikimate kinase AroL [Deltaproteobacteria bacterium]|nr:shikimate kinase AroL [Deltaproteobacteria bacterium]MBW2074198.1 shikimate kinase AroL [Deltaproteobacteria bacterium]